MQTEQIKNIIKEKVDGVWEARHTGSGHRYIHIPSGTYQNSVTTKLGILSKPHLIPWAVRVGVEWLMEGDRLEKLRNDIYRDEMITGAQLAHTSLRDSAGTTGSKTHSYAENYLIEWINTGKQPEDIRKFMDMNKDDPRAIAGARGFEVLMKKKNIIPLASEIIVGHPKHSAGAIDIICLWEGKLCLLDIKTSNSVDKNFRYQLAAYKSMFEFMTGLKIKMVKIIHLDKGMDKYTIYDVKELPKAWATFKHICAVYDDVMSNKEKVVRDIKRIAI